jgi:hypothetical protein
MKPYYTSISYSVNASTCLSKPRNIDFFNFSGYNNLNYVFQIFRDLPFFQTTGRERMNTVQVTKRFSLQPLFEIENPDFAHWYGLGVWWAMYGDGQGRGQYSDQYLFDNVLNHLKSGWYDDFAHGWFPMVGFCIGMIHGGNIDPVSCEVRSSCSLIVLHDPDFTKGYRVGREY